MQVPEGAACTALESSHSQPGYKPDPAAAVTFALSGCWPLAKKWRQALKSSSGRGRERLGEDLSEVALSAFVILSISLHALVTLRFVS